MISLVIFNAYALHDLVIPINKSSKKSIDVKKNTRPKIFFYYLYYRTHWSGRIQHWFKGGGGGGGGGHKLDIYI